MARARKTWREKLHDAKGLPKVEPASGRMSAVFGTGTVAIPAPLEVDALMRQVPPGKVTTINQLREAVAAKHGATFGCPMTTGIFAWIAAHAAEEAAAEGETEITPYWRTLKAGGELNAKYPGGLERLKERLEAEGHAVVARGKRWFVQNYRDRLWNLAGPGEKVTP